MGRDLPDGHMLALVGQNTYWVEWETSEEPGYHIRRTVVQVCQTLPRRSFNPWVFSDTDPVTAIGQAMFAIATDQT